MLKAITHAIENKDYKTAHTLYNEYKTSCSEDEDTLAILEASIYLGLGDTSNALNSIIEGLQINPINYELYFLLGNTYAEMHCYDKAYLCYQNALFHARNTSEDLEFLYDFFEHFCTETHTIVPKVSIIILTLNNLEYTKQCIHSIRQYCSCDTYELIVIDNGSTDDTKTWLMQQKDLKFHFNAQNLGFAGGCNVGIHLAEPNNDILLLNNDTLLTENALFELRMGLYENKHIGAAGAISNNAGTEQVIKEQFSSLQEYIDYGFKNNVPSLNCLSYKTLLIGFALLIKNKAYKEIGDLDEQFFPGNFEDNDYCTRLILKNYQLVLCKNSFIFHFGNKSFELLVQNKTYDFGASYLENRQRYIDKWHLRPDYSFFCRTELIDQINLPEKNKKIKVLEIGCACGSTLLEIKNRYPNAVLYGIELDTYSANFTSHFANVVCGNIEEMDFPFPDVSFDYIILGDILEHLVHPELLLNNLRSHLTANGEIITSIPNILHYTAITNILMGNFAYTDSGVLDRTHLRFFTKYNCVKLLENSGYKITGFSKNFEYPNNDFSELTNFLDALAQVPGVVDKENFFVLQYIFKATPQ